MQAIMETLFDIVYLSTVITLGVKMLRGAKTKQHRLYGVMAVVLGCGDAFHLVPRAVALCTTGLANYTAALGIGKLITSVTMTVFYLLLYYVWRERYGVQEERHVLLDGLQVSLQHPQEAIEAVRATLVGLAGTVTTVPRRECSLMMASVSSRRSASTPIISVELPPRRKPPVLAMRVTLMFFSISA